MKRIDTIEVCDDFVIMAYILCKGEKVKMENNNKALVGIDSKTREMTITALLVALVFISTKFINFKLPISINGGLVHMGNTMLFMSAIVFGSKKGAAAGAIGMGIFDILSGWAVWAPFTIIIRGVMGYIIGAIANANGRDGKSFFWNLTAVVIAGLWMLAGYYGAEGLIYGNWLTPITSMPGNILQIVFGAVIGLPMAAALKKINIK